LHLVCASKVISVLGRVTLLTFQDNVLRMLDSAEPIEARIQKLTEDFAQDQDWETRYKRVIDMGKALPELAPELRMDTYRVKGCQSQVWLHANITGDARMNLVGDSDAVIVRGLVACLLYVYSQATPDEILKTSPKFLSDIGFDTHLSPSRANGLSAMVKQIYLYATAFKALASLH
jgi:cysteine desulfuration protein SufE